MISEFQYKNHRGEIELRQVEDAKLEFHYNPGYGYQPGWFLSGRCLKKDARRSFALVNIILPADAKFYQIRTVQS